MPTQTYTRVTFPNHNTVGTQEFQQRILRDPGIIFPAQETQLDRIERTIGDLREEMADLATAVRLLTLELQLKALGIADVKRPPRAVRPSDWNER